MSDWDVASTTAAIPHPYEPAMADAWIAEHAAWAADGKALALAITDRSSGALVGSIALRLTPEHSRGELGYRFTEDEQREFHDFLERLRMAKDKSEFDQFMAERRDRPDPSAQPQS